MDFVFFTKKLVANLSSPTVIVVFMLLYACFLIKKSKVGRKTRFVVYAATMLLVISSSHLVTNIMLRPLEQTYPVYNDSLKHVDNIVILGCYNRVDEQRPFLSNIHDCSMSRIVEAIRLSIVYPNASILTSGGNSKAGEHSHAEVVKEALIKLGVSHSRIIAIGESKDTGDESLNLKPYLINKSNLLISEATHLKRAVKLFDMQGISVTPVPCRYFTSSNMEFTMSTIVPSGNALNAAKRLIYELLGNTWVEIKSLFGQ